MSTLFVIRHGQASFHSADYDQLSSRGEEQSRCLGAYWVQHHSPPDAIYIGPRKRHHQTYKAFALPFQEKRIHLPEPIELSEFDEYNADALLKEHLPQLIEEDETLQKWALQLQQDGKVSERIFQKIFEYMGRRWVRGEFNPPNIEPWSVFRQRVEVGLQTVREQAKSGQTIAIFSSGGPVATSVGHTLQLDDETVLELSWQVYNSAFAEYIFSGSQRLTLRRFNATPHLTPSELTFR